MNFQTNSLVIITPSPLHLSVIPPSSSHLHPPPSTPSICNICLSACSITSTSSSSDDFFETAIVGPMSVDVLFSLFSLNIT